LEETQYSHGFQASYSDRKPATGGGSVMVWGAVAASGVGNFVFVEGIMDRFQYKSIFENNLKASVDKLSLGASWIFQEDNDPKHTAKIVKDWLFC